MVCDMKKKFNDVIHKNLSGTEWRGKLVCLTLTQAV